MDKDLIERHAWGFALEISPTHLLHRIDQKVTEIFDAQLKGGLLTARQFSVLLVVSQEEGLSQTALVQKTGIDRSTLADIVKRMIKKGLLTRQRTQKDARAYSVKLTQNGVRALRIAEPIAKNIDQRLLSAFPDELRERFISDLFTILRGLEGQQEESSAS